MKRDSKGPIFQVNTLKAWRTPGNYCDHEGGGLYLQVRQVKVDGVPQFEALRGGKVVPKVTKYWSFRYWRRERDGKRRLHELGIGPFKDFSLQEARDYAAMQRRNIKEMNDPILWRRKNQQNVRDLIQSMKTFEEVAQECWEAHKSKWKAKQAENWINSLKNHVYPELGAMEIRSIRKDHIVSALKPIWQEKAETASRVRCRIEAVFKYAKGMNWYSEPNPAEWDGNLDAILVESPRLKKAKNYPSLPFIRMRAFMQELNKEHGIAAKSLEFGILTVTRSGEIRFAKWNEFDMDKAIWTIPEDRMKAGVEHRIPLSARVIEILISMSPAKPDAYVFPGGKAGKAQSDTAMIALIKRMDIRHTEGGGQGWRDEKDERVVPHGFRATFKTWAQDSSHFDRGAIEFALAHQLENKVEAAYSRGTMIEKRRPLMEAWAEFCCGNGAEGALPPTIRRVKDYSEADPKIVRIETPGKEVPHKV